MDVSQQTVVDETQETLSYVRGVLDKRQHDTNYALRVSKLVGFLMSSEYGEEDVLSSLSPFMPNGTGIDDWYEKNQDRMKELMRQDPRGRMTDRFDIEEEAQAVGEGSKWYQNTVEVRRLFPLQDEVIEASLVVKLLYKEANDDYHDLIAEQRRLGQMGSSQDHGSSAA